MDAEKKRPLRHITKNTRFTLKVTSPADASPSVPASICVNLRLNGRFWAYWISFATSQSIWWRSKVVASRKESSARALL